MLRPMASHLNSVGWDFRRLRHGRGHVAMYGIDPASVSNKLNDRLAEEAIGGGCLQPCLRRPPHQPRSACRYLRASPDFHRRLRYLHHCKSWMCLRRAAIPSPTITESSRDNHRGADIRPACWPGRLVCTWLFSGSSKRCYRRSIEAPPVVVFSSRQLQRVGKLGEIAG
ncbi:hypothetical protein GGD46_003900 [Rhizobium lusitanum]|uniref:Uncharacterized protein n=1 Tax=Rhizobium lusitanum TaxID=293958 RepID=A0A7X0IVR8_9HYPH|nr:hypothetical protein [Rhizobium lusitanum]